MTKIVLMFCYLSVAPVDCNQRNAMRYLVSMAECEPGESYLAGPVSGVGAEMTYVYGRCIGEKSKNGDAKNVDESDS